MEEMENQKDKDSKETSSKRDKKAVIRFRPRLSTYERVYLILSDLLSVAMIVFDLSYLGGMTKVDPFLLFIANIFMVAFSYVGYLIKKRARRRALRRLKRLKEGRIKADRKES